VVEDAHRGDKHRLNRGLTVLPVVRVIHDVIPEDSHPRFN
jgi:hypothetical protein